MLNYVFRTDASLVIGNGHVMRCLTLADSLRERGAQCLFICREHPGNLLSLIRRKGFDAIGLPFHPSSFESQEHASTNAAWLGANWQTDAEETAQLIHDDVDWLVIDHYSIDRLWEMKLQDKAKKNFVIDDLANRPHHCDLLLDQNLGRMTSHYVNLIGPNTKTLIGPNYALLRPEFSQWRRHSLSRRTKSQFKKLLISMGGADADNFTGRVLDALTRCNLPRDLEIIVVLGPHAPWLENVREASAAMAHPTKVLSNVNNMAELMSESDLAIGAAGSTSWERCCLGLPSIVFSLAENQKFILIALRDAGVAAVAEIGNLSHQLSNLPGLNGDLAALIDMSVAARRLVDGNGVDRVADLLIEEVHENYPALQ